MAMAKALGVFSVALGPGMVAEHDYEVKIGEQCYCNEPAAVAWWNSPDCLAMMERHRQVHSAEDYARMVDWMEKCFNTPLASRFLKRIE